MQTSITVNEEYQRLVPPVSSSEFESLKQSIKENGLYLPIVVNADGVVLDGHHRFRACKELGVETRTETKTFDNNLLEKKFVIEANLKRRHLSDIQRAELGIALEPIERELAKMRYEAGVKTGGRGHKKEETLCSNEQEVSEGPARDLVAKQVGLSSTTYQRAKTIIEKAPEELKEKVRKGETSISYAYKAINRTEKHKETPQLPEGSFDIILADPPWEYDINTRGSPDDHYQVMQDQNIAEMKVPAADDAILFLWATAPKLQEALDVMEAWGFEYKTHGIWIKDKIGTGYYFRGQHELLLVGRKGNIPAPQEATRPPSIFHAERGQHSKKPELVHDLIEQMYPNRKYLEMFARSERKGWEAWGIEA